MEKNTAKKLENYTNEEQEIKKYTYADLLEMDDDKRYEIIDGKLYLMSSPSITHQAIAGAIYTQLVLFLEGKKCTPFIAPLDVAFSKSKQEHKIFNVVQPDVMVVCDIKKLEDGKKVFGAPDFVIEILSPSTSRKDQLEKLNLYLKYKVKEYWIIDPENMWVWPYLLNEQGMYELGKVYELTNEEVPVKVLKGCKINLIKYIEENKEWLLEKTTKKKKSAKKQKEVLAEENKKILEESAKKVNHKKQTT